MSPASVPELPTDPSEFPTDSSELPKDPRSAPSSAPRLRVLPGGHAASVPALGATQARAPQGTRSRRRPPNSTANHGAPEIDPVLVARAQRGDAHAFRELVERHRRRAFAIAITIVRDEQDAQEIVQEAFLRVHSGLAGFTGGSSFFTWLYRIVTNLSIDLKRRPLWRAQESRDVQALRDEQYIPCLSRSLDASPFEALRRTEMQREIQKALEALPSYHRGVILMREVEGMSYEEMAEAMCVSKGTIMSRLFHARRKLQAALGPYYVSELGGLSCSTGRP